MKRLLLVRHAPTSATRAAAFPSEEPIEPGASERAAGLARIAPRRGAVVASPALRCAQTARAAGLAFAVEPRVAECDFGAWAGRTAADVAATDGDAFGAWLADPDAAPHGGESLRAFAGRVGGWLEEQAASDGATLAITHGGVVKACVVRALGAPLDAFWRVDVAPLSVTELHGHDGRWTVARVNAPVAADAVSAPAAAAPAGVTA